MLTVIGTCDQCEGPVSMPFEYKPGTHHPRPSCDWCGAVQTRGFGPILRMEQPKLSRRAAREAAGVNRSRHSPPKEPKEEE